MLDFQDYASRLEENLTYAFETARANMQKAHSKAKERYDHELVENLFKIGDRVRVILHTKVPGMPTKFSPKWSDPRKSWKLTDLY